MNHFNSFQIVRLTALAIMLFLMPGFAIVYSSDGNLSLIDQETRSGDTVFSTPTPLPEGMTPPPPDLLGSRTNLSHDPAGYDQCNGQTQRDPLYPSVPADPVCISLRGSDYIISLPQAIHYRINTGSWTRFPTFQFQCQPEPTGSVYYWSRCDQPANSWYPGANYGDRVDYFIEVDTFVNRTLEYIYNGGTSFNISDAMNSPWEFIYPVPTSTPLPTDTPLPTATPGSIETPAITPQGMGILLGLLSLFLSFRRTRR